MSCASFRRHLSVGLALVLLAAPALAWPPDLEQQLYRDALRLLPRSLAVLLNDRELAVLAAARESTPEMTGWQGELSSGHIRPETVGVVEAQFKDAATLMYKRQLSAGLVRMGATFRVAADVSDPVLCAGASTFPPGVISEYYAFVAKNIDKIPVVLNDDRALKMGTQELPAYWHALLTRSREDAPFITTELFQNGRLVRHYTLDYRSPVFGVGSLAYSRAVNSVAATWLAGWRSVRGDLTRMRQPRIVEPQDAPPPQASGDTGGHSWLTPKN